MSSAEFVRWAAFHRLEPSGFEIENWRSGMLAAAICNAVVATIPMPEGRSRPKPLRPSDFLPAVAKSREKRELTERQKRELKEIEEQRGKRGNSNR